jgi:hypothetical protein
VKLGESIGRDLQKILRSRLVCGMSILMGNEIVISENERELNEITISTP